MNKLPHEKRERVLHLLCEGMSIRAITRVTGVSKNTIAKMIEDVGAACMAFHNAQVRDVKSKRVQVDEIWSFTYAKQKNVADAKSAPERAGDTWTWTALDADSKLIVQWYVGDRDGETAKFFIDTMASRLATRVQLTSDGHKPYLEAVEGAFGADVDYAMLIKHYGPSPEGQRRYSPAECVGITTKVIEGNPDPKYISTSYVERQNLTMRMHMRRFTRLTNGFSKKIEQHVNAVALHFVYYNFCRIHKTLRVTPAMAAGITDKLWEVSDIVALVEAQENAEPAKKRGPYKKQPAKISN